MAISKSTLPGYFNNWKHLTESTQAIRKIVTNFHHIARFDIFQIDLVYMFTYIVMILHSTYLSSIKQLKYNSKYFIYKCSHKQTCIFILLSLIISTKQTYLALKHFKKLGEIFDTGIKIRETNFTFTFVIFKYSLQIWMYFRLNCPLGQLSLFIFAIHDVQCRPPR